MTKCRIYFNGDMHVVLGVDSRNPSPVLYFPLLYSTLVAGMMCWVPLCFWRVRRVRGVPGGVSGCLKVL